MPATTPKATRVKRVVTCSSCELMSINGIVCHETGCPDAWRDSKRECKWCGSDYKPEDRYQILCSDDCADAYRS